MFLSQKRSWDRNAQWSPIRTSMIVGARHKIEGGGGAGLGFPFILSKNVGCVSNGEDFDSHSFSKIVIRQMCNLEKGRLGNDLLLVV